MAETGKRIKVLLDSECQPAVTQLAECLADWYKMAQTAFLQARILDKDVAAYEKNLLNFISAVSENDSKYHEEIAGVAKVKITSSNNNHVGGIKQDLRSIRANLRELSSTGGSISNTLDENTSLIVQCHAVLNEEDGIAAES